MATKTPKPGTLSGAPRVPPPTTATSASKTEKKTQAAANNTPLWVISALTPVVSALDWMFGAPPPSARKEQSAAQKVLNPEKRTSASPASVAQPAIQAAGVAASVASAATPAKQAKPVTVISPAPSTPAVPPTTPAKVAQVAEGVLSPATPVPHTPVQPRTVLREPPSTVKDKKALQKYAEEITSLQNLLVRLMEQPNLLTEIKHSLILSTNLPNLNTPIQRFLSNYVTEDSSENKDLSKLCQAFEDFPKIVNHALRNIQDNKDKKTPEAAQEKAKDVLEFCKKFEESRKNTIKYIATKDSVVDLQALKAALLERDPTSSLRRILNPIAGKITYVYGRDENYDSVLEYAAKNNILTDWTKFVLESALKDESVAQKFKDEFQRIIFECKAKPFIDAVVDRASIPELEMALLGAAQGSSSPQKSVPKPLRELLAEKTPDIVAHFQNLPDDVLRKLAILALEQKLALSHEPPNADQMNALLEKAAKQDAEAIIRQKIAEIVKHKNKDMAEQFVFNFDGDRIRSCFDDLPHRVDAQTTRELASSIVDALSDEPWIVTNLKPIFLGKSVLQTLIKNALSNPEDRAELVRVLIEVERKELRVERNIILLNSRLFKKESQINTAAIQKFAGQNDLADFIKTSLDTFSKDTSLSALQQNAKSILAQWRQFAAFKTTIEGIASKIDLAQVEHALLSEVHNGSLPGNPVDDNALYDILDSLRPRVIGTSAYRQALNDAKPNLTSWTMIVLQRYDQSTKEGPHNSKIKDVINIYEEKQAIETLIPFVIGEQKEHPGSATAKILRIEELGATLINSQTIPPGEPASAAGDKNLDQKVYNYFLKLAHLHVIPLTFLERLQHASEKQHLRSLVISALNAELAKNLSSNRPLPVEVARLQGVVQYIALKEAERVVKAKLPEIIASLDKKDDPLVPNLLNAFFANEHGHALPLFFTTANSPEPSIETQTLRNLVVFALQDYSSQHLDAQDKIYIHLLKPISDWEVTKTAKSLSYFCLTQLFIPEPKTTKSTHEKAPTESYDVRCLSIVQDMISGSRKSFRAAIAKRFPELSLMQKVSIYFNNVFKSSILEYFISKFIFNLVDQGIRDKATPDFLRNLPKEALTTLSTSIDNYVSHKTLGRDLDATNTQEDLLLRGNLVENLMSFVPKSNLESYLTNKSKNLFLGKFLLWQWQPTTILSKLLKGAYYATIILPLGSALIGLLGLFAGWAAGILLDIPINQYVANRARKALNEYIPLIITSSFEGLSKNATKMAILSWLCEQVRETALTENLPQKTPEDQDTRKLVNHTLKGLFQTFQCLEGKTSATEVTTPGDDDQTYIGKRISHILDEKVTKDGVNEETGPKTREALATATQNIVMAIYNTTQGFTSIANREGALYLITNLINYAFDPTSTPVSDAELNAKKAEIKALASVMTAFTSAQEARAEVDRQVTETLDQNPWKKWILEMTDKVGDVHDKAEKRALPFAFACAEPIVLNFIEGLMNVFVDPQLCHTITIQLEKTLLAKATEKTKA